MAVTHALLGASALFAEHYCPPRSTYWGRSHIYSISSNWLAERELQKVIFLAQPAPKNSKQGKMQQPLTCSTPPPIVIIIIIVIVIIVINIIIIIMIKREQPRACSAPPSWRSPKLSPKDSPRLRKRIVIYVIIVLIIMIIMMIIMIIMMIPTC